jgi:hypothetical protein
MFPGFHLNSHLSCPKHWAFRCPDPCIGENSSVILFSWFILILSAHQSDTLLTDKACLDWAGCMVSFRVDEQDKMEITAEHELRFSMSEMSENCLINTQLSNNVLSQISSSHCLILLLCHLHSGNTTCLGHSSGFVTNGGMLHLGQLSYGMVYCLISEWSLARITSADSGGAQETVRATSRNDRANEVSWTMSSRGNPKLLLIV